MGCELLLLMMVTFWGGKGTGQGGRELGRGQCLGGGGGGDGDGGGGGVLFLLACGSPSAPVGRLPISMRSRRCRSSTSKMSSTSSRSTCGMTACSDRICLFVRWEGCVGVGVLIDGCVSVSVCEKER